jgi:hypothetical protein
MRRSPAEIVREYGPFPGADQVHGVTYDGQRVWFAAGDRLNAFDPATGHALGSIDVAAHAGTAFDGRHLFQLAEDRIQKIDPESGRVVATIPAPGGGGDSGLAWAEGTLWVGQYRDRKIHQVDPETGAILRTIESSRFVTGVTGWTESCGTAPGTATKASCATSIPIPARCSRASTCRPASASRDSNRTAPTGSIAAVARRERSAPCVGRGGRSPIEFPRSPAVDPALLDT